MPLPHFLRLESNKALAYEECGDSNGHPVFFFHGWPSSRLQARRFHKVAKSLNIRLISPDRPGYGQSDYDQDRRLIDWPNTIQNLADHLNINKFSVIGISGGGHYAVVCAYALPKRVQSVAIVVGLSPTDIYGVLDGMALPNKITWYLYHKLPFFVYVSSLFQFLRQKAIPHLKWGFLPSKADKRVLTDSLQHELAANRQEAYRQGRKGTAKDLELYTNDWGFELNEIKSDVHLWYGEDDKNVSLEMGRCYEKHIPNSELFVKPNTGHLLLDTHAKEVFRKLIAK